MQLWSLICSYISLAARTEGIQLGIPNMIRSTRLSSAQDVADYLTRLRTVCPFVFSRSQPVLLVLCNQLCCYLCVCLCDNMDFCSIQIQQPVDETIELLREGIRRNITAPKTSTWAVADQIAGLFSKPANER